MTTLAGGGGTAGYINATGQSAEFNQAFGVVSDGNGNVYVGDSDNFAVRKVDSGGVVTTFVGAGPTSGDNNGPGATATFNNPSGVSVDAAGEVFSWNVTKGIQKSASSRPTEPSRTMRARRAPTWRATPPVICISQMRPR